MNNKNDLTIVGGNFQGSIVGYNVTINQSDDKLSEFWQIDTPELDKIPGRIECLFGRDLQLKTMDELIKANKRIISWVGSGGIGKSSLIKWYLKNKKWKNKRTILAHSFYSQGHHNQVVNSRHFIEKLLRDNEIRFTYDDSDFQLGEKLAILLSSIPTILILDGIEPLQVNRGDEKLRGNITDQGILGLLTVLAEKPGEAICLVTSRLSLTDFDLQESPWFSENILPSLSKKGARDLLRQREIIGNDDELDQIIKSCNYHAFSLTLAAEYIYTFAKKRADKFLRSKWASDVNHEPAQNILLWFDGALTKTNQFLLKELLRILGLFDRPFNWDALMYTKECSPLPGLNTYLNTASKGDIVAAIAQLRQWHLMNVDLSDDEPDIDSHPIVREFFANALMDDDLSKYKCAHFWLRDYYIGLSVPAPYSIAEMTPLVDAIAHGCMADEHLVAFFETYSRALTQNRRNHLSSKLGAHSTLLSALSSFFPDGFNNNPVNLGDDSKTALLCADVSRYLEESGRPLDAIKPREFAIEYYKKAKWWGDAFTAQTVVISLKCECGQLQSAKNLIVSATDFLRSIPENTPMFSEWQSNLKIKWNAAKVAFYLGDFQEAIKLYQESEEYQGQNSSVKFLYSRAGFDYCCLLLDTVKSEKNLNSIIDRASEMIDLSKKQNWIDELGLGYCILGRAFLMFNDFETAKLCFDQAATYTETSWVASNKPFIHLGKAFFYNFAQMFELAWKEQSLAFRLSRRMGYLPLVVDCQLFACLMQLQNPNDKNLLAAEELYSNATKIIKETGYGRRECERLLLLAKIQFFRKLNNEAKNSFEKAVRLLNEKLQFGVYYFLIDTAKLLGVNLRK